MTEKLQRINGLLRSKNPEMVRLGVYTAINTCNYKECTQIIPFYMYFSSMEKVDSIELIEYSDWREAMNAFHEPGHIYIKGEVAIAIINNRVCCRTVNMMKVMRDFEKIPKTYF